MHRAVNRYGLVFLVAALHASALASPTGQQLAPITDSGDSAVSLPLYPGAEYEPSVPTLEEIVGHAWAERITSPEEVTQYLRALDTASPRTKLVQYGSSWEGRPLHYMVVASEANMARLDEVQAGMQQLADPRSLGDAAAEELIASLPSITWLAYGVHGDEISSSVAAMLTAYHLVAVVDDPVARTVLDNSIVIIDAMQNPDGRARVVQHYRQTRGRTPDAHPLANERVQAWPGGRYSHYLFDINRDWFAQTQIESRGRTKAFLDWFPQVHPDLHEMGTNGSYYFAPPAPPINPEWTPAQLDGLALYGENNARWFDRMGFAYYSRQVFDSFYPGYGDGWPLAQGSIGMTYEVAGVGGLVVQRNDDSVWRYRDSVQRHFTASLATAETTATNCEAVLRGFYNFRRDAIAEGAAETVKEYILPPGRDPGRTRRTAALLMAQGIEVRLATAPFTNPQVRDYYGGPVGPRQFETGTYVVSLAQPTKHLIKMLMVEDLPMDQPFVDEQLRRYAAGLDHQIYDISAWSLPLVHDLDAYQAETPSTGEFLLLSEPPAPMGRVHGGVAQLAYLLPWGHNDTARALARMLREGLRVRTANATMQADGVRFPRGSLIVDVRENPETLHATLERVAADTGAQIYAVDSSWVEEGVNFGSPDVRFIPPIKVAIAYDIPTDPSSAGWTRYLLEQSYDYPVTVIPTRRLGADGLDDFNVLVLPHPRRGGYDEALGRSGAERIRRWVRAGGTLITFRDATSWLTTEGVGLLSTARQLRDGRPEGTEGQETRLPYRVPGAIFRVQLDPDHWLSAGYDGAANVMVDTGNVFRPLEITDGTNVALYSGDDDLVLSGFVWPDSAATFADTAYLMHQPHGSGHVVAFAEEPNFRAYTDGLNLLFLNAVFFGPAH